MSAHGRVTVTCCGHQLVGFQEHIERGTGLDLGAGAAPGVPGRPPLSTLSPAVYKMFSHRWQLLVPGG